MYSSDSQQRTRSHGRRACGGVLRGRPSPEHLPASVHPFSRSIPQRHSSPSRPQWILPYAILRRVSSTSTATLLQPLFQCALGVRQRVPVRCSRECTPEDAGANSALTSLSASISCRMLTAIRRKSIRSATAPSTLRGSACQVQRLQALRRRRTSVYHPCHKTSQVESVIPVVPSDQVLMQV